MFPINPDLINDLAQKRAAIFIGAGVSAGVTTKAGTQIKTWGKFLTDATQEIFDQQTKEHAISLIDQKDYLMACEMISRSLGGEKWRKTLQAEYKQRAAPSELQKNNHATQAKNNPNYKFRPLLRGGMGRNQP